MRAVTARALVSAAYPADRAAALAGVPRRTLYYWAKTGLVVPTVSRTKLMRWSYADLLLARLVDWLRQEKPPDLEIARTSIRQIRENLERVEDLGERLMTEGFEVYVDKRGGLIFGGPDGMFVPLRDGLTQHLVDSKVNLVRPFEHRPGMSGPDLAVPRPSLRIVPGKLSGEPHVARTRVPTQMLAALSRRGFDRERIRGLYPTLSEDSIRDALDLEDQLERNLQAAA
jgi:uncharacterized protein (DUF433 family)/DNA-binding transcriptional MerR regulator